MSYDVSHIIRKRTVSHDLPSADSVTRDWSSCARLTAQHTDRVTLSLSLRRDLRL